MIQTTLTDLFGSEEDEPKLAESPIEVMKQLTAASCSACRLGLESPNNPGFIWRGNPDAHIAILGDMPSVHDMSARRAFADELGNELNRWLKSAGISDKDVFLTYIVQCKTPVQHSKIAKLDNTQRVPNKETEIGRCFPERALRIVRALPNLEVLGCLGLTTMKTVLGGDPQIKSHQGKWFGSDLFPGVAVFGMPHPRDFDAKTGDMKRGRLKQCLQYFRNEYYGKTKKDGTVLSPPKKILGILRQMEKERRDAKLTTGLIL